MKYYTGKPRKAAPDTSQSCFCYPWVSILVPSYLCLSFLEPFLCGMVLHIFSIFTSSIQYCFKINSLVVICFLLQWYNILLYAYSIIYLSAFLLVDYFQYFLQKQCSVDCSYKCLLCSCVRFFFLGGSGWVVLTIELRAHACLASTLPVSYSFSPASYFFRAGVGKFIL